jgi:transcriptional regulator with XRE-family HTH domain
MRPLAKNLRKLRVHYDITQEKAAELLNIGHSKYQSYEEDRAQPDITLFARIVKTFNITDPMAFATRATFKLNAATVHKVAPSIFEKHFNKLKGKSRAAVMVLLGMD